MYWQTELFLHSISLSAGSSSSPQVPLPRIDMCICCTNQVVVALQAAKQQLRGQELPRKPSPGSSQ